MKNNIKEEKMSTETDSESSSESWTTHDKEFSKSRYGCEILKERCTVQDAKDNSLPLDAYLVTYIVDNKIYYDITRSGKRVSIFDMYYDKFGKDSIQDIRWSDGKINPKLWGYKTPEKKKRK